MSIIFHHYKKLMNEYLYNNKKKELRTTHEILAIMLAFEVEEITRIVARKSYSAEGLQKLCSAR